MDQNPKATAGRKKFSISSVPMNVLGLLAVAMEEGALKYGRHNFRQSEILCSDYVDPLFRHFSAFVEGEDIDPVSGLPHLVKIMATCAVMLDSIDCGTFKDDRPPALVPADWQEQLNLKAMALREKFSTQKK